MTPFSFTIQIGAESLSISGSLPDGECEVTEIIPLLLKIGEEIVAAAIRQAPPATTISCGPGCGACCRQLVPISLSEAAYLRHVVLPQLPPDQRQRVAQRLSAAAATLASNNLYEPLLQLPLETHPERRQAIGLRYFLLGIACPFLENDSCSIHPIRPLACREYLVTSPAPCCANPSKDQIDPLRIPQQPSHALIQLDAADTASSGWLTMLIALLTEPAPTPRRIPQPVEFLKTFLTHLLRNR
ncbi:MAG: YkgJ family cysteine cluster protein [Verrucomicrobiota bacterium]